MVCADGIDGSICDLMAEAGEGLAGFFENVAPAFLTLAIVIALILTVMAVVMVIAGFLKKAKAI